MLTWCQNRYVQQKKNSSKPIKTTIKCTIDKNKTFSIPFSHHDFQYDMFVLYFNGFFFRIQCCNSIKVTEQKKNGLKCLMSYNVSDEIAASGWQKKRLKKLNFIIKYNVSNRHCIVEQKPSLEKKRSSKQDLVKSPHVSRQLALGRH